MKKFDADKSKQRVLESMDIFGGEGNFRKLCEKIGVSCKGNDILYDNVMHNFVTETGFFFILTMISMMLTVVSGIGLESFFGGGRYCRSLRSLNPCMQPAVDCHCVHLRWSLGGYYVGLHVTCMCSCPRPSTADLSISPMGTRASMQCGEHQIVINLLAMLCIAHSRKVFFLLLVKFGDFLIFLKKWDCPVLSFLFGNSPKSIRVRLEQPGSSMMWLLPEMYEFIIATCSQRVHSWMKCFGHELPKPVFVSNITFECLEFLERKWSKRMEKRLQRTLVYQ